MDHGDVSSEFNGQQVDFKLDSDNDGVHSAKASLFIGEAFQEAFKRGVPLVGAKVADIRFEGMKVFIVIDTDRDGEPLFIFEGDLPEGFDEASQRI